jgi:hypothetical protein
VAISRPMAKASGNGTPRSGGAGTAVESVATESSAAETPEDAAPSSGRRPLKLSTVSHTLDKETAERLRYFAFRERISESAVIEHSLRELFVQGDDSLLGRRLRGLGAGLRRKA